VTDAAVWIVAEQEAGARLDRFIADRVRTLSRVQARRLVEEGRVLVGGQPAKPARLLVVGEEVRLEAGATGPAAPAASAVRAPGATVLAPDAGMAIVYEDEHIVVVDKPVGLVTHPGAGRETASVAAALVARYPQLAERFAGDRPGIVHRLDRDTSGIMVAALTGEAAADLVRQFAGGTVDKTYLALVDGIPAMPEAEIDAPIGRHPGQRKRMAPVAGGKAAATRYRVVQGGSDASLLQVSPRTGRTHQIRVHLAAIGHPVLGESVYGRRRSPAARPRGHLALHAWRLAFTHPATGTRMEFTAPPPEEFIRAAADAGIVLPVDLSPPAAGEMRP
jgi:23S rRNA pseudouridine1911/1915/1917 synthase